MLNGRGARPAGRRTAAAFHVIPDRDLSLKGLSGA